MELRQLKYFVAVADALNFSDAADKLCITQGTLSQQIKQLEDELGTSLFHRTSRSVSLTEEGAEMLPLAIKTLESSYDCRLKISDLKKSLSGTLNIGLTSSFREMATDTMRSFIKEHPGVKLNVYYKTATELLEMLLRREIDICLAFKPSAFYEEIESEKLFESRLSAVMRKDHPLSGRKTLSISEIEQQSIALPGSGLQARRTFEKFLNVQTSNLDVHVELNDPNTILDLLHGTNLIALLSSAAVGLEPNLVAIPLEGINGAMTGCVHWLKGAYRKKSAVTFVDMLRDSAVINRIMGM
ncbi:MAG: LysR family transcriptional regulator [Bacteroidales bacterium]|nr:LysR family transcriptional regulator [Bacteroidales bacterium]